MINILKSNAKLYIVWLLMILCISIGVATTQIFSIIALAIFAVFTLTISTNESCVLLFGLLPFASIFKYQANSMSFFTICELLVVVLSFFKCKKIKESFLVCLLLFSIYMIATSTKNFNLLDIIKILLGFYLIYLLTGNAKKEDVINISYMLATSTILTLLLSVNQTYFAYIKPYMLDLNYLLDSSGHATNTLRISGFLGDPNYCSALIILSVALLSVLYYYKNF